MIHERKRRIEKIQRQLLALNMEACLISTSVNLLYTTGQVVSGYHFIPAEGASTLFIRRPEGFRLEDIPTFGIRKPEDMPGLLLDHGQHIPSRMLVEAGEMSHTDWLRLQACFASSELVDGTRALRYVRSVKTDYELDLLRASAAAHVRAYAKIPSVYRPGMTDIDFSIEIERLMRLEGNKGLFRTFGDMEAFMGSVLAGDNAAAPSPYDFALGGAGDPSNPIGANGTVLQKGHSVMVDMCGNFTGYLDDITRSFSLGKLSEKAYRAHQVAIEIEDAIQERMVAGAICEDMHQLALDIASKAGLSDCFMGSTQQARFVGHGVGLVINEPPVLALRAKDPLEAGMVLAVEPKFVIEGVGAVGLEDTYIVHDTYCEKISHLESGIIDLLA